MGKIAKRLGIDYNIIIIFDETVHQKGEDLMKNRNYSRPYLEHDMSHRSGMPCEPIPAIEREKY